MGKDRVAYYYDSDIGRAYFGANHPMKPHRLNMTHSLVLGYGLHKDLEMFTPAKSHFNDLMEYHSIDYLTFLQQLKPDATEEQKALFSRYGIGDDCPPFEGLYDFCSLYAGASLDGARRINSKQCDIAINWAGGLHHAKKAEASGFCYINDLVLAILELLKYHARVLYVDIDVHHGDGVEEAFYLHDRVMTVSFHKYGDQFFPMTGDIKDIGEKRGKYYTLNVPLASGIDDNTFHRIFKPVMEKVMDVFKPEAIVLQCGADSLADDRLGPFMLSLDGHAAAVKFMKDFNVPMLVCGGGGYTKNNVARCWALETAVLVGKEDLENAIPQNAYYEYYAPEHQLRVKPKRVFPNMNSREKVEEIKREALENLRHLSHAPGVQMKEFPPESMLPKYDIKEEVDPDIKLKAYAWKHHYMREFEAPGTGYDY